MLSASFEDYRPLGPLAIARVRRVSDGTTVVVRDLDWTPIGTAIAVGADGLDDFVYLAADTCRIGPLTVARKVAPRPEDPVQAGSGTRWDRSLVVRVGAAKAAHRWSAAALALEDASWLYDAGFLGCDLWRLDDEGVRAALAGMERDERALLLTLVLEWVSATMDVRFGAGLVAGEVHRRAVGCAETGRCEEVLGWLRP